MSGSEEKHEAKSFITLELDTGPREFQSLEELKEWADQERSFFAWMEAGAKKDSNSAHAWNVTNQWLGFIDQFIQQFRQNQNNEQQRQNVSRNFQKQLSQHLQKGHLLSSTNPDAIFAKNLSGEEDEVIACYAASNLLEINVNQSHPNALKGAFYAFQYRQGVTATVEAQVEALNTLSSEWNVRFKDQHLELRAQNEQLIQEISELRSQFSELKGEIEAQKDEQASKFKTIVDESEKTLSDIAHTYDEKLALQASVQYWTDKRKLHSRVMWGVGAATLLLAALTGGGFVLAAHKLLQVTLADVQLWRLGVMLAISTFGIWVTRLSAKIFISNLHLRTDADERVTMIQTYLALLREGSGPMDGERQLILQTLFRPSNTGFIKDDGPSSFHDVINNAFSRKNI
ncbi:MULTISPECIES: DUF6161 domain-containing protein [Marinobacter]|uniref:DUF6161 domain-containing protein n=1 Tax=Marinobacter TaxID=2742 RepID=UPI0012471EE8|nr:MULTISPECIES: DUF6161 domain-containing protein [Marinobacter]MBL3557129.1 hypothetical protein [Marinobacter sp. JB05H06]